MSIFIQNATFITLEGKDGGVLYNTDMLVVQGKIAAIGDLRGHISLSDSATEVIDGEGFIVIPGLVNAHQHTWQTALRGLASNMTFPLYSSSIHEAIAPKYQPKDIYIANLIGALNQINSGTTTMVDWCHNNPTPEHTDAAVKGLADSGIRAFFFHGSTKPKPIDGEKPYWEVPHSRTEIERLVEKFKKEANPLLSLGVAILGPQYSTWDVTKHDFKLAKDFGLIASMHVAGSTPVTPDGWDRLLQEGMLGPSSNLVHANNLTDAQLRAMVDCGVTFSIAAEGETCQGHGFPITRRLHVNKSDSSKPVPLSLGIDVESVNSGDLFTAARVALGTQRMLDNANYAAMEGGKLPSKSTISCLEALEWVTKRGAEMLHLQDHIGSLKVGKKADIVLINAKLLNMCPVNDPINSVIMQASLLNVDTVIVDGVVKKRGGELIYSCLEEQMRALVQSQVRLVCGDCAGEEVGDDGARK